jgi:hypothetical protein
MQGGAYQGSKHRDGRPVPIITEHDGAYQGSKHRNGRLVPIITKHSAETSVLELTITEDNGPFRDSREETAAPAVIIIERGGAF